MKIKFDKSLNVLFKQFIYENKICKKTGVKYINNMYDNYEILLDALIRKYNIKLKIYKYYKPWINNDIITLIKKRNVLKNKNNVDLEDMNYIIQQINDINKIRLKNLNLIDLEINMLLIINF